jgi:hypothetical protein
VFRAADGLTMDWLRVDGSFGSKRIAGAGMWDTMVAMERRITAVDHWIEWAVRGAKLRALGSSIDGFRYPSLPATLCHPTRQLCPAPDFVSVSCFGGIIITINTATQ